MTPNDQIDDEPNSAELIVDDQLIAACRRHDRAAQQRLYELTHDRVARLMTRMVGMPDADDLSQQVFLQAFRKLDQFSGQSKFETWLYRLAVNEALQHLRRRKRAELEPLAQDPTMRENSEQRLEQRELLELALDQLDPELKAIFLLRELHELSYREIAVATNVPEGTVGSRLNRARRELQRRVSALGLD